MQTRRRRVVLVTVAAVVSSSLASVADGLGARAATTKATPYTTPVAGAAYAGNIVVDRTGRAFVTNPSLNEVEVLSLATGALEAPIPVGSGPEGLDFSPDDSTLYVINSGENDISVVDLTTRRELRRLPLPSIGDVPMTIAVANTGVALVATSFGTYFPGRLLSVILASGVTTVRNDSYLFAQANESNRMEASGDRARIGVVGGNYGGSPAFIYDAATDSFSAGTDTGVAGASMALDESGSRILVAGVLLYDRKFVLQATIPGDGGTAVLTPDATTAYRSVSGAIQVIDTARALVTGTVSVPDARVTTPMALSSDGTTVVVATPSGITVAKAADAAPAKCAPPPVPAGALAVCGGPLKDVVISGAYAYASNYSRNEVEVVSLGSGQLEPPIPVGSEPRGLDFSADGTLLYVADSGADSISVVDVAQRREIRRITWAGYQPFDIAVAKTGVALVIASTGYQTADGRMLSVDLASGAITPRGDFIDPYGHTSPMTRVKASGDRSRIGIGDSLTAGLVFVYDATSDSFSGGLNADGFRNFVDLDATGSKVVVNGTQVYDGSLVLHATIPGGGGGTAATPDGTTAYRSIGGAVQALDLNRGLVTGSISVPNHDILDPLALSPDGSTLVVATSTGISLLKTTTAAPVAGCTATAPPGVVAVCGAPLADVVVSGGYAYASNMARNEVDVISIATGQVEAQIPVGSEPQGMDFSPDGKTLYVANSGGSDVSVVDVASRREVRRFALSLDPQLQDRPFAIAVADNGYALLATTSDSVGFGGRMLSFDLATGTMRVRTDFNLNGWTDQYARLAASGDRSRIGIASADASSAPVFMYDAASDTFTPATQLAASAGSIALDESGATLLLNPGGLVLAGDLTVRTKINTGGTVALINSAGTIGYAAQDSTVWVMDLQRGIVTETLTLPEPLKGGMALTTDGQILV
ncbi:MAG: hypothetical protein ACRDQ6_13610, partial [Pseudonocardiaceae bacterium]